LDYENWQQLSKKVPGMIAKLERGLQRVAGSTDFLPSSPEQVAELFYGPANKRAQRFRCLRFEEVNGRSTEEDVLKALQRQYKHPAVQMVLDVRALYNVVGTFLKGYKRSADAHSGQVWAGWFLTGAATGRLRSGKGASENRVNLQNTHGSPLMQHLLVSDPNWRRALEE
jgi:DNA polymerase I-like protein with 3'-5' exonuclease and polymerase domains